MTWIQVKDILEREFSASEDPIESVDLLGGEPLSNFPVIPAVCDWVWTHSPDTKVFARTNGTLLTDDMKTWFINHRDKFVLGLSLDGVPEANLINRGVGNLDLDFFLKNWPQNPIKMTVFPDSVQYLSESLKVLYSMGAELTCGLAQGIRWDTESCNTLRKQLSEMTEFYIENEKLTPVEPLYDLNFHKAFWIAPKDIAEEPCWTSANIHSYDCDGELLPCHMFSRVVQGPEKREKILQAASRVDRELYPAECNECPIRWCCKNCMAMNYQHTGDFSNNINRTLMCEAQKIAAEASAEYIIEKKAVAGNNITSPTEYESLSNAIKYLKKQRESNE